MSWGGCLLCWRPYSKAPTPASTPPSRTGILTLLPPHRLRCSRCSTYYDKKITELNSRITCTLPARMSLPEQSAFQIGYYHETQKRYAKKEEN